MPRTCNKCCKKFASRQSLWNHKKRCKGVGNHTGSGLLYSTNTKRPQVNRVGKTSVKNHENVILEKAHVAEKVISELEVIENSRHGKHKMIKCKVCAKSIRSDNIKRHQQMHASFNLRRECATCGKTFKLVEYLRNHERNAKPIACDTCDKMFCHQSEMERHKRTEHIGGNVRTDDIGLNQPILPQSGFEEDDGYKIEVQNHWDKIRDAVKTGECFMEINKTVNSDFTYSDLEDILKDTCFNLKHSFKVNIGFGFMLRHNVTKEYRYFYVSSNNLLFDRAVLISKMSDVRDMVIHIKGMDLAKTYYMKRPSSGWILVGLPNVLIKVMYLKSVPLE